MMALANQDTLSAKGPPRGRVVDGDGSPVAGVTVLLYHRLSAWGLGNRVLETVVTNADGRFVFTQLLTFKVARGTDRHDHYFLLATHDGFAPAWKIVGGGAPEEESYSLVLTQPISATFSVVDLDDRPVAGATVYLRYAGARLDQASFFTEAYHLSEDSGICHGLTDTDGRVTLSNLPDTEYQVAATKPGYEVRVGENLIKDGLPVFVLRPEGVLEGQVRDSSGNAVEGATVWIYPTWRFHVYFVAKTDNQGRYRIEKIWCEGRTEGSGKYKVGIRDDRFTATTREVAFARGQKIRAFDIEAVPGTQVVGTLLDQVTQAPVAGAEVYVDSSSGRQTCLTRLDGGFTCRVMPGEVRVFFGLPPGGTYVVDETKGRHDPSTIRTQAEGAELAVTSPDFDTPVSLLVSDRLVLRVEDGGQHVPVEKLISYFVWMRQGEEWVRWRNMLPDQLDKMGADLALPREALGHRAGHKIDMVVETADGKRLLVSGTIPEEGTGLLRVSTMFPSGPPA